MYKVLLYGAGVAYCSLLNLIKLYEQKGQFNVVGVVFFDAYKLTTNDDYFSYMDGYPLVPYNMIKETSYDYIIICGTEWQIKSIRKQLIDDNIPENTIISGFVLQIPYFDFDKYIDLLKSEISIISMNCYGGSTYKYLGLKARTPFYNMFEPEDQFIEFLKNAKEIMLNEKIVFQEMTNHNSQQLYPHFKLGEMDLYMNHYSDKDEAEKKWYERLARVNWDNLFVTMYSDKEENIRKFSELPYNKKMIFTSIKTDIPSSYYIPRKNLLLWEVNNRAGDGRRSAYDVINLMLTGEAQSRVIFSKSKNVLCHCLTVYQFLELIIYKDLHKEISSMTLVTTGELKGKIPNINEFIDQGYFNKIIYVNTNHGFESDNAIEAITEFFDNKLNENGVALSDYDEILVAGAYRNFGVYISAKKLKFKIFEDASGTLSRPDQENYDRNSFTKTYDVISKFGLYYGENDLITTIYCDLKSQKDLPQKIKDKTEDFTIRNKIKKLNDIDRKKIMDILHVPDINGKSAMIFTQWFISNGVVLKDERIILHYQYLCDVFAGNDDIVIKPHPSDPMDYSCWFNSDKIIYGKFPIELIDDSGITKVISLNSTANNAFTDTKYNIKIYQDIFSPLSIYNKLMIAIELAKKFDQHSLLYYGLKNSLMQPMLKILCSENKHYYWKKPDEIKSNSILIIDHLDWGIGTSKEQIAETLKKLDNSSIMIFLDRDNNLDFWSLFLYDIMDNFLPVEIKKEQIKDKVVAQNMDSEFIWIYCNDHDILNRINDLSYDIELKNVGIKISKNPISKEDAEIMKSNNMSRIRSEENAI